MDKEIFISGREHKASAELQRIFSQAMLFVACRFGAIAGVYVVSTQKMEQGSMPQSDSFISERLVVDQEREVNAVFFAEEPGVAHITQANHGEAGAFLFELFFEFAQLRDVLSAEDSTVVPEENQHRGPAFPQ